MSDKTLDTAASGTVGYTRKVQVREYESAEASIFIQFEVVVDPDIPKTERGIMTLDNAKEAFFQAKTVVFEELGIDYEVDAEGTIRELVGQVFGNVTEVVNTAAPAEQGEKGVDATVGPTPPFSADTRDKDERKANTAWAKARYASHPNEFWDNRQKKASGEYKSNGPDLKHKDHHVAVWLD